MNDITNWPRHSIFPINESYNQEKIFENFLFENIFYQSLKEINEISKQIIQLKIERIDSEKIEGFLESLYPLIDKFSFDNNDHTQECLLAIACLKSLISHPSPSVWKIIQRISYYTHRLEYILPDYCIKFCIESKKSCKDFIILSEKIINEYIKSGINFNSSRISKQFINLKEYWKSSQELSLIWSGLPDSGTITHEGDRAIFKILFQLDKELFINLVNNFKDPYSTLIAINATGSYYSLSTWTDLLSITPVAFDKNYEWNKSFILPLLLNIAYGEIHCAISQIQTNTTVDQLNIIQADVDNLIHQVINLIITVRNGIHNEAIIRWATWLISKLIKNGPTELSTDYQKIHNNNNYLLAKFLDEIVTNIPPNFLNHKISEINNNDKLSKKDVTTLIWENAEQWENWAFHALISHFCLIGNINPLLFSNISDKFFKEWRVDPNTWYDNKGSLLRNYATQFIPYRTDNFPNYGIQLLAYTFYNNENPNILWLKLLYDTIYLREVIEYAPYYVLDGEKYKNGQEARYLMQLIVGIGISLIDFFSNETNLVESKRESAQKIYSTLSDTLWDLRRIDKINADFWEKSLIFIILRRAYFGENIISTNNPNIFDENTFPTFKDQISYFKYDTHPLINIIYLVFINGFSSDSLKTILTETGLDLKTEIAKNVRLNELHPNKYPINQKILDKLSTL